MRIPADATIAREKLTDYLLRFLAKDDKSRYLQSAGFTVDEPEVLESQIRAIAANADAVLDRQNRFGSLYRVNGSLFGPNATRLAVVTIWHNRLDESWHFVTLYPDKEPAG